MDKNEVKTLMENMSTENIMAHVKGVLNSSEEFRQDVKRALINAKQNLHAPELCVIEVALAFSAHNQRLDALMNQAKASVESQ